ncbi:MAG: hypothetical protein K1X74_01870 [Pirellulales bacterium]|nr:hypothetical protein [Pirellulales bacterium]
MLRRAWDKLTDRFAAPASNAAARADLARRATAAGTLALVAATWPLWTPLTEFPRVPIVPWPSAGAWLLIGVALAGLVASLVARGPARAIALVVGTTGLMALVLDDQQRFQPWIYQAWLWSVVLATAAPQRAVRLLRLLVASIYVYAALAKLDATFATTLGPQLVAALAGLLGLTIDLAPAGYERVAALALPGFELLVGAGLCVPRLRTWAIGGACAMHGLTILALSPWGLDHRPGVLLWNLSFATQGLILYWPGRKPIETEPLDALQPATARARLRGYAAELVTLGAILWPLGDRWGWCDNWPAWGLYATRAERVTVLVHEDDRARLPAGCREFLAAQPDEPDWYRLRLDRWSLEVRRAPLYPQRRTQLAVTLAVARRSRLRHPLQVLAEGRAGRFSTRRDARLLWGEAEINAALREFVLPAQPHWPEAQAAQPGQGPKPAGS